MNTAAKLVKAMRQNPQDWTIENLLTVAKQLGQEVRSNGGSHHIFHTQPSKILYRFRLEGQ